VVVFFLIGGVGVAVLLLSLVAGDVLPGHLLDGIEAADGFLSTAALGGFAGALGLGGATTLAAGGPTWLAVVIGVAIGLAVGAGAGALVRSLRGEPEERAGSTADLVGAPGTVVSPIPLGGYGEVSVTVRGSRRKLSALADLPLGAGAPVHVTHALSSNAVRVARATPQDAPLS
jgi:membrane protein implicated in regulation of membrane protease activity